MASGHGVPHQQAGHMAAPTSLARPSKKTLANGEPSTHGTSATCQRSQTRSGVKGIADERCDDAAGPNLLLPHLALVGLQSRKVPLTASNVASLTAS